MSERSTDGPEREEYLLYYELDSAFGAYLRGLREANGYSLRKLEKELGIPYHYIHRLEKGERVKKPSLEVLEKMALVFRRPLSEVEQWAGVRRQPVPDPHWFVHERFKALMLHTNIRAPGVTEEWLEAYSTRQKREIINSLINANNYGFVGGRSLHEILREAELEETGEGRQRDLDRSAEPK